MSVHQTKKAGMSLVEVVIAASIALVLSVALISADLAYLRSTNMNLKTIKAIYLAEEGVEVINFIGDNNWSDLGSVGTDYYLVWTGSAWIATTTKDYIDQIYERKFSTASVNRDLNNDITTVGGTPDVNTRMLTVQVSWSDFTGTTTKSISAYLMKK